MPTPTVISFIALAVSIASICLAFYLAWRDRSRVQAKSVAHLHERTGEYSTVFITATNVGRRPITLRYLGGVYEGGNHGRQFLSEGGLKLQEGEFYEFELGKFDGVMVNGDNTSGLVEVFLEDSSGKKYKIKDARKNVALVRGSKHPFGVRA